MTRREFIALHAQQPAMPATMGSGINPRVSGDRRGDAVGFSVSTRRAMQRAPTSRKSGRNAPYRPINFGGAPEAKIRGSEGNGRMHKPDRRRALAPLACPSRKNRPRYADAA